MLEVTYRILVATIFIVLFVRSCFRPHNFPPGPTFLPIIGSWYCVNATGVEKQIPKWRQKYGYIIGHKIMSRYAVFISSSTAILEVLKNPRIQSRIHADVFQFRSFYKLLGFFFNEGDQWSEVRRFTLRHLASFSNTQLEEVMHDEMNDLFQSIRSGSTVEINEKFTVFSLNAMLKFLFGINKKDYAMEIDKIRETTHVGFKNGRSTGIEVYFPLVTKLFPNHIFVESVNHIRNFVSERIEKSRNELNEAAHISDRHYVSAFLLEQRKKKQFDGVEVYSDEQLVSCIADLIQPANESTGNTVGFLLLHVALHPHVQRKLHEEIDRVIGTNRHPELNDRQSLTYCNAVISETIRIRTIAPIGVAHVVTANLDFHGYFLPKDTIVYLCLDDSFHDPQIFDNPTEFQPERFVPDTERSKISYAFGLGERSCLGQKFAKNSLFLFVAYFFQKYSISLPKGCEKPDTESESGLTSSVKPYKLVITERQQF